MASDEKNVLLVHKWLAHVGLGVENGVVGSIPKEKASSIIRNTDSRLNELKR